MREMSSLLRTIMFFAMVGFVVTVGLIVVTVIDKEYDHLRNISTELESFQAQAVERGYGEWRDNPSDGTKTFWWVTPENNLNNQ